MFQKIRLIIPHFVVLSILMILTGKVFWGAIYSDSILFVYGVAVSVVIFWQFYVAFFLYKDPYLKAQEMNIDDIDRKKYFVSCLVAVWNEEEIIERCVESFVHQTYPYKEIIFINDASRDKTMEVLRDYENRGLIKVIDLKNNVGKKRALAEGMKIAKGNIFAFSDSDSVLAPNAVEIMVDTFIAHPELGAISGHTRALNGDKNIWTRIQDPWYETQYSVRKAFESHYGAVTCVSGPLAVFRRESIFNFIPAWVGDKFLGQEFKFATDRTLTGFVLGATSVGKRLKEKYKDDFFVSSQDYPIVNWKIGFSKSAKAWTNVPDTFAKMIKQQIRWKKSFIRNTFFTGQFYWKKPLVAAIAYYLHIVFVVVGPFIAFRHLIYLPISGNIDAGILYVFGVLYVGFMFGLAYKLENPGSRKWMYRPLMSLLSTAVYSWLIFYSALTVKKMVWSRG